MKKFVKIKDKKQVEQLEGLDLKDGFSYFFSLFFKKNDSRDYLLQRGLSILFIKDDGVINGGNLENISDEWQELNYNEFLKEISL